ncbi:MAG TPA: CGNR zinc finger domain-containing protein [Gaiellales bacterium]|nr:CGNR zinc finger domain-containing protein [Gaiellales bacterium]
MTDTAANPAPGALLIVQELVNTLDVEAGTDAIETPAGLRDWLRDRSLAPADLRPTDDEIARMAEFREALRGLLRANNGDPVDPEALRSLNRAGRGGLRVRFDDDGTAALVPQPEEPIAAVVGSIVAIVFTSIADGTFARLKACPARDCGWAFYDLSKNRSARWCSMAVCGSREKVRAHRARQVKTTGV